MFANSFNSLGTSPDLILGGKPSMMDFEYPYNSNMQNDISPLVRLELFWKKSVFGAHVVEATASRQESSVVHYKVCHYITL